MTDDGSGLISSWTDRIGGMAITATTTARPTWGSAAFNGGYAGVTFDGTANCFVATSLSTLPSGSTAGEIWGLYNVAAITVTAGYLIRYGGLSGANSRAIYFNSTIAKPAIYDGSTAMGSSGTDVGNHITGGNWSNTTEGGRDNGSPTNPASASIAGLNTSTTRLRIGASNNSGATGFLSMVLRHLIVTTLLNDLDRLRLEGWLAWDCGLQSLLPNDHPFRWQRP